MSTFLKKELNVKELEKQLDPNEQLQFLFVSNCTPIDKDHGERFNCKNGHFNFLSNSMPFEPNTWVQVKCDECDEIVFEYKPYAVRIRPLDTSELIMPHSCKDCKELSQTFHPDDDWFCRKGHVGLIITKVNTCEDFGKKERK